MSDSRRVRLRISLAETMRSRRPGAPWRSARRRRDDLTALPKRDTGFVYRNEIVAEIRDAGTITPDLGARLDGRLSVSAD